MIRDPRFAELDALIEAEHETPACEKAAAPLKAAVRAAAPRSAGTSRPQDFSKGLSKRDRDMIQGVMDGKRNKEIAFTFGVSENTVKIYVSRLFAKLGVGSRLELAQWGRAYAEAQRRVLVQLRELSPDEPDAQPTFKERAIAEETVLEALIRTTTIGPLERQKLAAMLLKS